jgi:hypothetical protein
MQGKNGMLTLLNALGIVIVALSSSALGYFLTAIIYDLRTKKT